MMFSAGLLGHWQASLMEENKFGTGYKPKLNHKLSHCHAAKLGYSKGLVYSSLA